MQATAAVAPPPPADTMALDFDLPEELILDAVGRILCVVCKVYVPRGEMNTRQHLGGKKHAAQARTLSRSRQMQRKATLVRQYALERETLATATPAEIAAYEQKAGLLSGTVSRYAQTGSASASFAGPPGPSQPSAATGGVGNGAAGDDDPDVVFVDREAELAKLKAVTIDKPTFLSSVLASDDEESEAESILVGATANGAENNGVPGKAEAQPVETLEERQAAFTPVAYHAPADVPDLFFESMPEEVASTEKVSKLREVLSAEKEAEKSAAKISSQSPGERKFSLMKPDDGDGDKFLALARPLLDEEENITPPTSLEMRPGGSREGGAAAEAEGEDEDSGDADAGELPLPPWLIGEDAKETVQYHPEGNIALHYEILEFERFMSPTREEEQVRRDLVRVVASIVRTLWPGARLEVFGSYATNLFLPTSDIDVCVLGSPAKGGSAPDFNEHMELAQAIRNVPDFARRVNFIKARVPLVKIVARNSNVQCDISFNRGNGPGNVPVIKQYIADYPALRPLLMVLKSFLQQRSLNEVFSGGLGSYSILLLVVSHLQMSAYNFPGSKADLGTALLNFFRLYGRTFNYCLAGIRVKQDGAYYDKSEKYHAGASESLRFSIEDPNDETNELGRNSFAAARIRKAFGNAAMFISGWRRDDEGGPVSPLSTVLHIDDNLRSRKAMMVTDFKRRETSLLYKAVKANIERVAAAAAAKPSSRQNGDVVAVKANSVVRPYAPAQKEYSGYPGAGGGRAAPRAGGHSRESAKKKRRSDEGVYGNAGFASSHQQRGFVVGMGNGGGDGGGRDGFGDGGGGGGNMVGAGVVGVGQGFPTQMGMYSQQQGQPQMGMADPYVPAGGIYETVVPAAASIQIDQFTGYAQDPRQLAQMQGLQYAGGGMGGDGMGGVAGGGWGGAVQSQQFETYEQYDPRMGQGQGQGQGQSWRGRAQGAQRQGFSDSRGGGSRSGGSRGGGRGGPRGGSRGRRR